MANSGTGQLFCRPRPLPADSFRLGTEGEHIADGDVLERRLPNVAGSGRVPNGVSASASSSGGPSDLRGVESSRR